ncbi:beta-microseminoprotein [Misgurnus anguillicaudatus]|uniref:beta-microseminoprotein n=1 Tax=Misgurnus anguillicaudatus TaxID=75329 RepID=UPI003CCF6B4D
MRSVVLGVFLCAVFSPVHPACFRVEYKPAVRVVKHPNSTVSLEIQSVKFCQDLTDKTWHPVGTTWRNSKCMDCTCSAELMECCDVMKNPVNYPDKCTVERDYTTCTVQVVEKKQCPYSATGK